MRAPRTSDVRQRPSTNAELPVDGRDDQLTSGGRAAARLKSGPEHPARRMAPLVAVNACVRPRMYATRGPFTVALFED